MRLNPIRTLAPGTTEGNAASQTVTLTFPTNTSTITDNAYTIKISLDGGSTWETNATYVTVSKSTAILTITSINAGTATITAAGGTSVITITGTNLPNGITVTAFDNATATATAITGTTTESAASQTVTLTFPANTSTTTDNAYTIKYHLTEVQHGKQMRHTLQ